MPFNVGFLLGPPPLFIGAAALLAVVLVTALLTRSWRWVLVVAAGAVVGYFLLGTALAHVLEDRARARGRCQDAGWNGPAAGALLGATFTGLVLLAQRLRSQGPAAPPG